MPRMELYEEPMKTFSEQTFMATVVETLAVGLEYDDFHLDNNSNADFPTTEWEAADVRAVAGEPQTEFYISTYKFYAILLSFVHEYHSTRTGWIYHSTSGHFSNILS